ncbi:Lipase, GDSL [Niveomyces insectorum RCEF 264]|uniref:Lipase, GDSL n=1 Tax=Niveomyces insectorum RCEF 264 TaxID=1081102 RepID=A0A167ST93_9HYPO|nr:Lipase, GDSL [Niveomyces insectorum RCEF 264]
MDRVRHLAAHAAVVVALAAASTASTSLGVPSASSLSSASLKASNTSCKATAQWPGWAGIDYAFIFGDSYTQTGFVFNRNPAPSPDDPLGNPSYPGYTASNGPNWVGFLTTQYNASRLQTYNLASGGATVDAALVKPFQPTVLSLKDQVLTQFLPGYTNYNGKSPTAASPLPAWRANNTLVAVWIGINDVGNTYGGEDADSMNDKIFAVYGDLVDHLYTAGVRNFAFLTVPPVDRSPLTTGQGAAAQAREKADLAAFNGLLTTRLAGPLQAKHANGSTETDAVNTWVFDTAPLFNAALDKPATFPQTAGLKNTTTYCSSYANGTPARDTLTAACGVPVNEYFWLNSLHPTYPIHDVVAEHLAKALTAGPNVCGK